MNKLKDLKPNPGNPRTISDEKLELLKRALDEFGDLGGFVYNRNTKRIVSGHQRHKVFEDTPIHITKDYKKPTRTGTVAEGFVVLNGEQFKYREVFWDETKEKAGAIAANKGAGDWDEELLGNWLRDLDDYGFDLDLTMMDEGERIDFMEEPGSRSIPDSDDTPKKNANRDVVECPNCGYLKGLTPGIKRKESTPKSTHVIRRGK